MKSQLVKKLLAGSLATAMTISLMACGGSAPAANQAAETPADTTEVAAEAPAEDTAAAEPEEELAEAVQITPTHMKHIESEHRKPSV